ncbi:MAG: class I SAM-dependent RNA methyltransferase [Ilumatobacteraceae bacterium]|nr:class I SAM-dependent RNA methyltransferase [Ilumatobacteraceae bacterium]
MESEIHRVQVEKLVAGGEGLARLKDGRVVFVPAVIAGETVDIQLVEKKTDFARALLYGIVEPSPFRRLAPCPEVARGCGGCDWQHMQRERQSSSKADIVKEAFQRTAKLIVDIPEAITLPDSARRTTVRMVAGADGIVGFRGADSHDVVTTSNCMVAHDALNELLSASVLEAAGEVTLRVGARTGDIGAWCHEGQLSASLSSSVKRGERAKVREIIAGHEFQVSMGSFFQPSPEAAEMIADTIVAGLDDLGTEGGTLIDAYGGIGLFAGCFAHRFDELVVVENSKSACGDAIVNLADCAATIVECSVEQWNATSADVVIADPARAGLGKAGVRALLGAQGSVFILVSCDAVAAARDVGLLAANGYSVHSVTALDLFPETHHVEVVSVLTKS